VCDHREAAHDGLLSSQPGRGSRGADITRWKTRAKDAFAGLRVWRCLRTSFVAIGRGKSVVRSRLPKSGLRPGIDLYAPLRYRSCTAVINRFERHSRIKPAPREFS
jgi:hypothetical protein